MFFIKYYASILDNILDHEYKFMKERGLEIFQKPELSFKVEFDFAKGHPFYGKIDRIDVDKTNKKLYVADYKTSSIPKKDKIDTGEDVQLAIYIMAIAKDFPDYNGYDAYYISIKELKHTEANFKSLEEARRVFSYYGDKAVQGILNGDYNPNPIDPSICEDCDYRRCCGAV
jgi:ATP-dependent helicase/DNAse subunit B